MQTSYGPFLGGKRICLGSTFAPMMAEKILKEILVSNFKFEFVDDNNY